MTLRDACDELARLCDSSQGMPVDCGSGRHLAFIRRHRYSELEIARFERDWAVELPSSYRLFLQSVGSARCYMDRYGHVEFFGPEEIHPGMQKVFVDLPNPFPQLLIVVAFTKGEQAGFQLSRPLHSNFGLFDPECPCEEWVEQAYFWSTFDKWLPLLVSSGGVEQFV
jgi:hypothetical protein